MEDERNLDICDSFAPILVLYSTGKVTMLPNAK